MYFLVGRGLSNDDVGEGGKGRRISADTAGSWFQNRQFRQRNVGGATVERLTSPRFWGGLRAMAGPQDSGIVSAYYIEIRSYGRRDQAAKDRDCNAAALVRDRALRGETDLWASHLGTPTMDPKRLPLRHGEDVSR